MSTYQMLRNEETSPHVRNNIYVVASNWFVNRCPLVTRVPRVPVGATTFMILSRSGGVSQFCETWTQPVQPESSSGSWLGQSGPEPETRTPFTHDKMDALQRLMEDMEHTSYYGQGSDPAVSLRPRQKGLRTLIEGNRVTAPVTPYTPSDLVRDALERCRENGGDPDVLLVASNFMCGLAVWGQAAQRIDAGVNVFGTPIDLFEVPCLPGISVIEAPLLKPGTAVSLTSHEVRMRVKRNEFWSPRGAAGEPCVGEWVAEGAIEIDNPKHHAWIEGITSFAP